MIKKQLHQENEKKNKNKSHFQSKPNEQQTNSDTLKKTSFKYKFTQWLKQLPLDQRYLAVKVFAPGLAKKLQQTLIDLENQSNQQSRKQQSTYKRISPRQTKQIIESIVLISDGQEYFDHIGFDFSYIEHPDKLYELLTITLSQQQKQFYLSEHYQIQSLTIKQPFGIVEKSQSKQQLSYLLISFLRVQIFLKYEEKLAINLEEERNRKKEFSMFWRNLSEDNKRKILLLNRDDYGMLAAYLTERKIFLTVQDLTKECSELMQMEKNEFCNKIFKCKLKKSLTYFTDYHQLVYKMWKSQLNKKKKRTRNHRNAQKPSTSLNRNGNPQTNERPPTKRIMNKNQKQFERQKEKGEFIIVQKEKIIGKPSNQLLTKEQNSQSQKPLHGTAKPSSTQLLNVQSGSVNQAPQKRKRNRNNRRKKSVSAESKETNTTSHKFQKQEKQVYQRKIEEGTSITSLEVIETLTQTLIKDTQIKPMLAESTLPLITFSPLKVSENLQETQTQILTLHQPHSQQFSYPQVDFALQLFSKLKSDIQQYSDLINEQANEFYERRVIAYQRIQFILGMWKIPIKLFGSCASGITIKNSDIDIAIDNSILNYFMHLAESTRLRGALEQLEQLLQQQPWVTGMKLIKTAAIPLIKMKVNTAVSFSQIPGFEIFPAYLQGLNRQHASAGEIHIDLTIETINKQLQCNHLGIISTDQINHWLKSIKSLHSIVIIIKNYLTKTNLNSTYEGGLNTYSMMCMIVAFIKENKLEEETDVVKVFQRLAKFYAYEFDQKLTGIELLDDSEIFYDKMRLKLSKSATGSQDENKLPELVQSKSATVFCQADLQIKDPLNNGKIMTKNCYSFPKIKQIFQQIYETCFVEQQTALQTMFKEQFKAKYLEGSVKMNENCQEVKEMLRQCKNKLGNPFLTLFE